MLLFVLLLVGTVGLTMAGSLLMPGREGRGRRAVRGLFASLATYGGVALVTGLVVNSGGQGLIGPEVEWPVGHATDVARDPTGRYVVPHRQAERVQVYDAAGRFERGFFVETGGGVWKVRAADGDRIEVFTRRNGRRAVYDWDGALVEQGSLDSQEYADIPTGPPLAMDPGTPWPLRPFAHPFNALALMFLGALGLSALDRVWPRAKAAEPGVAPDRPR
jgi:hypothetical protein